MKRPTLSDGFHLLAAFYWLMLLFPPLSVAGALAQGSLSFGAALYGQGLFILLALLGGLFTRCLLRRGRLPGLLRPPAALLLSGIGFLLSPFSSLVPRILFALLCAAAFIAGTLFHGRSYAGLHEGRPIPWLLVTHIGAAAALWGLERLGWAQYRLELLSLSLSLAFIAYALCRNQLNIDFHMERRRHRLELLPQKIRIYNLWLMLGVCVLALLLFLLRGYLADGLRLLGQGLLALLIWILYLLKKLAELFHREEPPSAGEEMPSGGFAPFQQEAYETVSDFWLYLILLLTAAALLWWKRREILHAFYTLFQKLGKLVQRLFSFRLSQHPHSSMAESPYYTDQVASLPPEQVKAQQAAKRLSAREWKKAYHRYLHMPEESEQQRRDKFRSGHRLVLRYLAANGCFAAGDTVHELGERALSLPGAEGYSLAVGGYDHVRYGEYPPSEADTASLQQTLCAISGRIGHR